MTAPQEPPKKSAPLRPGKPLALRAAIRRLNSRYAKALERLAK